MSFNGKVVNLERLNRHILECEMPKFESKDPKSTNKANSIRQNSSIYIYENQRLYCPPIKFELKSDQKLEKFAEKG